MNMRLSHAARSAFVSTLAIAAALPGLARAEAPQDLVDAATKEGMLTVIALPHDWCNYGAVIEGFKAKYPGITVNELNPDAGTADELRGDLAALDVGVLQPSLRLMPLHHCGNRRRSR